MRILLVLAVMLAGCGGGVSKDPSFPESVAPGWTRSAVKSMDAASFPALLRAAGVKKGWETEYRTAGGAVAKVDAYAILSNTQGLDLVQRWRPERDNAQFYTEHFLLNVGWEKAGHDELAALVRSLPKLVEGQ